MSLRIRRGGGVTPTSGGEIFGPSDGRAAVIAAVGPRTVADPGGGTSFNSSASLQSAINASSAGSTFVCSVNNPTWNTTVDTGSKAPKIYFPGPVGQKVINGGGDTTSGKHGIILGAGSELHGGEWTNFGDSTATSGPPVIHAIQTGDNCIVEDVWVHDVHTAGVNLRGNGARLSYSLLENNGRSGIEGGIGNNRIIEYCEVSGNNTGGNNPGDEGGAWKILFCNGGHFHHNYAHDNLGFGPWWDTDNESCVIEENVSEDNYRSGLFYEANRASIIRHNYVANNGRATAIGGQSANYDNCVNYRISDSDCSAGTGARGLFTFNIADHTLTQSGTLGGLLLMWHHAGASGTSLTRTLKNWDIVQNQFWARDASVSERIGGRDSGSVGDNVWDASIVFTANEYRLASLTTSLTWWSWGVTGTTVEPNPGKDPKTWAQWQAFGQDTTGTRVLI